MRIIGVNKFPEIVTQEQAQWADEVVGLDHYDRALAEADFVFGSLPRMPSTNDFFNGPNCFSKMKKSAVFINTGRGTTCDEDHLAAALTAGQIAGAVLDVYKVEPLPKTSKLWSAPNLFMTPHCADQDSEWLLRSFGIFEQNLKNWAAGKTLNNYVDKEATFKGSRPRM